MGDVYSPAYRAAHAAEIAARRSKTGALPESWYRGLLGILTCVEDFDLSPWPAVGRFIERVGKRPAVIKAMKAEGLLS